MYPMLSNYLMQELTSTPNLSLWNSLSTSVFLSSYDQNLLKREGGFKTFIPFFWLTIEPAWGLASKWAI